MNQLLDQLDPETLHTYYLMNRTADQRPWIVVEGDDECHVLDPHIDQSHFQTVPAYGKGNVLGLARRLREEWGGEVFYLADRDFDDLLGLNEDFESDDARMTRMYDFESELIFDSWYVFRRTFMVVARGSSGGARITDTSVAESLRIIETSAQFVGAMRYFVKARGISCSLDKFPMREVIRGLRGGSGLAVILRISAGRAKLSRSALPSFRELRERAASGARRLVCGHDLIAAFAAEVSRRSSRSFSADAARDAVLSAFGCEEIARLSYIGSIRAWATRVSGRSPLLCGSGVCGSESARTTGL